MMDGHGFRSIISELQAVELALAATVGTESERDRLATVRARLDTAVRTGQLERVVDALVPSEVPGVAAVWHAHRTASERLAYLQEHGAFTATEVADRAGSRAGNRSALASAWRAAGRVLAVEWGTSTVFPAFQFDARGRPRPAVGDALKHLRVAGLSDWQQALWFNTATGWLGDRRPIDVLDSDPAAVERAAAAFHDRPT